MGAAIPLVISIDVEPDGFQRAANSSTKGYDATVELIERLRPRLERATGKAPSFGWYFRMDPQIDEVFGRPDHFTSSFGTRVQDLVKAGDHLGLHTHPLRWSSDDDAWMHDVTDPDLARHSIESSIEAFRGSLGLPCHRHRMGAALYNQVIVDVLDRAGVLVDSALEPVRGVGATGGPIGSGTDTSELIGFTGDDSVVPDHPYRPAAGDFRRSGNRADGLVLLPMTASRRSAARPTWQTAIGRMVKRRKPLLPVRALPLGEHPSAVRYWNLMARHVRSMHRPYISVALRTGAPDSAYMGRVRSAFDALVEHPLASRVEVVDPLDALPRLLEDPAMF